MRVLFVGYGIDNPRPGAQGASRTLLDFMMKYDDLDFITFPDLNGHTDSSLSSKVASGTPIDHLLWMYKSSRWLRSACRKYDADIINIHSYGGYATLPPHGVPTVVTLHNEPLVSYRDCISMPHLSFVTSMVRLASRFFIKQMLSRRPYAIALSSTIRTQLMKMGINKDNIVIIPNGFPTDFPSRPRGTRKALEEKLGIEPGSKLVLSVGAVVFGKGIHKAIQASVKTQGMDPRVHFIHVGKIVNPIEKSYFAGLRRLVGNKRMTNFHFLGAMDHGTLQQLMQSVDVYLSTSLTEACSLSLMEAMIARLPIVCTDVGAARDLLGTKGLILQRNCRPKDIYEAIIHSIDKPKLEYPIVARLTWNEVAKRTVDFYHRLVGRGA